MSLRLSLRPHTRQQRLVQAYLDGEAGPDAARAAAAHLRECFECSEDAEIGQLVRYSLRRSLARGGVGLQERRLRRVGLDLMERA